MILIPNQACFLNHCKKDDIMTIRHLRIFITVYREESITKAANELNMTQPTVTRAIKELEDHYSRQLFMRIHRRLYVTEAGKKLYKQAVHIVSSIDQIEKGMSDWDKTGILRIGAGVTLGCILLPSVLSEFRKKCPDVRIHSIVTDKARIETKLMHNEIDFALIEGTPTDPSLKKLMIGNDRMVLILPASHPLCALKDITIEDLKTEPIIVTESGSAIRYFLEHLFSIHGMTLSPVMESSSIPVIVQAVQAGIGISLIPHRLVSLLGRVEAIEERKLSYEVLTRENYLVWHENKYIGNTAQEFIEQVKSLSSEILS